MPVTQLIANRHTFFGRGSLQQLIPLLQQQPGPVLLFCGRSFLQGEAWQQIKPQLEPLLCGTEIVSHEATPDEIDTWTARWRGQAQRVLAIGGGSVIDAAKAVAALTQHPLNTLRYLEKVGDTAVTAATLPVIAVPTTAGTGSEVTQNAVITDKQQHKVKASLRHPAFVPEVAILDADLLRGTPDQVLACCAIDAFTHLFEAFLSAKACALTRQTALSGLRQFMRGWPVLNQQGEAGDDAREQMQLASWQGGQCLSMAGLGVIHGIAGELGALRDYHHGEVCGRLLLPFLTLLSDSQHPQQLERMQELGDTLFPASSVSPALQLNDWLREQAITPFWQNPPLLSESELSWILERANSKNAWISYSREQQEWLIREAFTVRPDA